jgi:hypothetical protein
MVPDWCLLPPDLVHMITEKVTSITDFMRFRAVCTAWRSASSPRPRHLPLQLPWLVLSRGPDDGADANLGSSLSLYDLSQSKTHTLDFPQIQGKRICGSSHGWLILEKKRDVWLFNPITRDQITLPSLSAKPSSFAGIHTEVEVLHCALRFCIRKAILSSNPRMHPNCLVMALFWGSWQTAFCKIGDECWTTLILAEEIPRPWCATDISYHNGFFYAINGNGHAWICDIHDASWKYLRSTIGADPEQEVDYICTVEGGCDEHKLIVFCRDFPYRLRYEPMDISDILMLAEEEEKWLDVEEKDTSQYNFFFSGNFHCISLPVADLQLNGWKGNCICYISPQLERRFGDVDWYSFSIKLLGLDDRNVTTLASQLGFYEWYKFQSSSNSLSFLWLTPTLC